MDTAVPTENHADREPMSDDEYKVAIDQLLEQMRTMNEEMSRKQKEIELSQKETLALLARLKIG